jgi:putative Mg2+ transporter-C (MgtC) family protein
MTAGWEWKVVGEVALAMLLGGLIGIEREAANKPAGFRTHMLVSGAAALLVSLGHALVETFQSDAPLRLQSDPIRIVEAIVTGVSFLGAGTIFRRARGEHVEGLTTAAALLLSAALGICVALERGMNAQKNAAASRETRERLQQSASDVFNACQPNRPARG